MPTPNIGDIIHITSDVGALTAFAIDLAAARILAGSAVPVTIVFPGRDRVGVADPTDQRSRWVLRSDHFSLTPQAPVIVSSRPPANVRRRKIEPLNLP